MIRAVSTLSDEDINDVMGAHLAGLEAVLECETLSETINTFWRSYSRTTEALTWLLEPLGLPSTARVDFFVQLPLFVHSPPDGFPEDIGSFHQAVVKIRGEFEAVFEEKLRTYLAALDGLPREYALAAVDGL